MRIKSSLESIQPDADSSFRLLHNPRLNDIFYWHFHPEYELVYIEGANGTRHVGKHTSQYTGSDLVIIGSNIPHLNFDYGVRGDYEKVVLQVNPSFTNKILGEIPEMSSIHRLFERSQHGIAFYGETKIKAGEIMKTFHRLSAFEQFLETLRVLQILAHSDECELLHREPVYNPFSLKEQLRLRKIYDYVDEHYQQRITVDEMAKLCHLERSSFCRYFKKSTGQTFVTYLNQYRISHAKKLLLMDAQVTEACYACGFESLSYFNRIFKKVTGENPIAFKNRHLKG